MEKWQDSSIKVTQAIMYSDDLDKDNWSIGVLDIDLKTALSNMQPKEFAYLQIVPPSWMLQDDALLEQVNHLSTLYNQGKIVWGAIVQANRHLFHDEHAGSCPAQVVYDPVGQTPLETLLTVAQKLYQLKHTQPDDPELLACANHITSEQDRNSYRVPTSISQTPLITSVVFVWRPHLPDGKLSLGFLPMLVDTNQPHLITCLPARFWEHSSLHKTWLSKHQNVIQTSLAFYQLDKTGDFWQEFNTARPIANELIYFAKNPVAKQNDHQASELSLDFIKRCFIQSKLDYQENSIQSLSSHNSQVYKILLGLALIVCYFAMKYYLSQG